MIFNQHNTLLHKYNIHSKIVWCLQGVLIQVRIPIARYYCVDSFFVNRFELKVVSTFSNVIQSLWVVHIVLWNLAMIEKWRYMTVFKYNFAIASFCRIKCSSLPPYAAQLIVKGVLSSDMQGIWQALLNWCDSCVYYNFYTVLCGKIFHTLLSCFFPGGVLG